MHKIEVDLKERSYPIYVGIDSSDSFPVVCNSLEVSKNIAIITDRHVAPLHLKRFSKLLSQQGYSILEFVIPSGERQKSLSQAASLYSRLLTSGFSRNGSIIALGGGVVGDLAGFVSATYRRGVEIIQVPTTLLAQVESAIGGKVAVNHPLAKNAIGAFHQPKFVFSDVTFLSTLPKREVICGLGELLKYAILDREMFDFIEIHLDEILPLNLDIIMQTVIRCNTIKAKLISEDERELKTEGGRQVLNMGHTIGHALENLSHYKLHHGEAVLIGLRWELLLAREAEIIDESDFERIHTLYNRISFEPDLSFLKMNEVKKNIYRNNRKVKFILPRSIGDVCISKTIDSSLVQTVLHQVKGG